MIEFACQVCGKRVQAPDDKAGRKGKCLRCGAVVEIPRPSVPPKQASTTSAIDQPAQTIAEPNEARSAAIVSTVSESSTEISDTTLPASTRKCPYCTGELSIDAKKCRHCGEWLNREQTRHLLVAIVCVALAILVLVGSWYCCKSEERDTATGMKKIEADSRVGADLHKQYMDAMKRTKEAERRDANSPSNGGQGN